MRVRGCSSTRPAAAVTRKPPRSLGEWTHPDLMLHSPRLSHAPWLLVERREAKRRVEESARAAHCSAYSPIAAALARTYRHSVGVAYGADLTADWDTGIAIAKPNASPAALALFPNWGGRASLVSRAKWRMGVRPTRSPVASHPRSTGSPTGSVTRRSPSGARRWCTRREHCAPPG